MRRPTAALIVAALMIALQAPPAAAAPTQVQVRIEGKSRTVFEGPVLSDSHRVRDANDSQWRRCNGVTGTNPSALPAVVPTSASSDAMRIIGESFDGLWYSQWEDYFVERWGPDAQEAGSFKYWGVIVNNVFTEVGGCQYQLDDGDEVLWTFDAFNGRPRLMLYPATYSGGALPGPVTATLNQPFEVEVDAWTSSAQGAPPASPTRSTTPYVGAEVAPVTPGEKGFQTVDVANAMDVTDADGRAAVVFDEYGWHRIKATDVVAGVETVVRSNRLDVCVPEPPATGCGPPPADTLVRTPPPPAEGEAEGSSEGSEDGKPPVDSEGQAGDAGKGGAPSQAPSGPATPAATAQEVRLQAPRLDRSRVAQGLVGVSWKVLDAGPGIKRWTISSKALGRRGARWTTRASGRRGAGATVRLPTGGTHLLRLTVLDALGRSASRPLGRVQVPR